MTSQKEMKRKYSLEDVLRNIDDSDWDDNSDDENCGDDEDFEFKNNFPSDCEDDENSSDFEGDYDDGDQFDTSTAVNVPKCRPGTSKKVKDKIQ